MTRYPEREFPGLEKRKWIPPPKGMDLTEVLVYGPVIDDPRRFRSGIHPSKGTGEIWSLPRGGGTSDQQTQMKIVL